MSGISKYKYQSSKFDSEDELKRLNIKRLIHFQDLQLKTLLNCISESIIDKNDLFNITQELIITNKVLNQKYE